MQDVKLQIRITGMTSLINKRLENILQITSPDSKKTNLTHSPVLKKSNTIRLIKILLQDQCNHIEQPGYQNHTACQ